MILITLLLLALAVAAHAALIWACIRTSANQQEIRQLRQELYAVKAALREQNRTPHAESPADPSAKQTIPQQTPETPASAAMPAQPGQPVQPTVPPPMPPFSPNISPVMPQFQSNVPPVHPQFRPAVPPSFGSPASRPAAPAQASPMKSAVPAADKKQSTLENWLGRNVLGVAASLLVFIGLIFLGMLVYKNITDTVKILAMYALSGLITGLGLFLSAKERNSFTLALTGCGCGSFFISVMLTHIYFGKLSDPAAFGLLLLWMAATLLAAKWQKSTLLSVIAHAGMILSLCFAFAGGISDEKLLLVLLYQAAASAVILAGNIFCWRKTYHFGVFASLGLTILASGFMLARFLPGAGELPFSSSLPTVFIAAAFAVQFLMASAFSYLLAISASRLKEKDVSLILHLPNKLLWAAALCMNVYTVTYRLAVPYFEHTAGRTGIALLVCLVPLAVHAALTLVMQSKLHFSELLECISVLGCFLLTTVFLLIFWFSREAVSGSLSHLPQLPWIILPALALLLLHHFRRRTAYFAAANSLLGLDFLFALFGGYGRLTKFGTPALALAWMLLYAAALAWQWYFSAPAVRKRTGVLLRTLLYLLAVLSLLPILGASKLTYPAVTILLIQTGLHFLLLLLRYDRGEKAVPLQVLLRGASLVLVLTDAACIAYAYRQTALETVLYFLLSVLAFFLTFVRLPELFYDKRRPVEGIVPGALLTLLVLAVVKGNTDWFSQSYILSLTCMLTALLCILAGFLGKVSSLRFYGLILTLVCVLKLVTFDVSDLSTLLRVVALIGGGVICFIVSAMYNYTAKHLKKAENRPSDPGEPWENPRENN